MKKNRFVNLLIAILIRVIIIWIPRYFEIGNHHIEKSEKNSVSETESTSALEMEILAYREFTDDFIQIETNDVYELVNSKQPFILYTGRVTCEWCRKIVPILHEVQKEKQCLIYYLDSEDTEADKEKKEFRNNYGIDSVPSIIQFFTDGEWKAIEFDETETSDQIKKDFELQIR